MKNNIFIITAAHQYIYLYDAIIRFHHNDNNILLFLNFHSSTEFLSLKKNMLDINWEEIIEIPLYKNSSYLYRFIQYQIVVKKLKLIKINFLYISQYSTSYSYLILNSVNAEKKLITDDGQALLVFSKARKNNLKNNNLNYYSLKSIIKRILYKQYEPKSLTFFTTNNISIDSKDNIIQNNLSHIRQFFTKLDTSDSLLFLGSPFIAKKMMSEDKYFQLIKLILTNYSNKKIFYYPHRAEKENNLQNLTKNFKKIEVISSVNPIEFYLMSQELPAKIISFYSGAIPNLLNFFKGSIKIDAIKIPSGFFISSESLDIANSVYDEYQLLITENFNIINLEEEK